MTREQRKLNNIKSIVKEAYDKVNENNGYYVVDVSHLVEELAVELELDVTFDDTEIKDLKKAKFRLSKDNQLATKTFRKTPIVVEKWDFSEYTLRFGKGRGKELEDNTCDIYDITDSTSGFFTDLFQQYKENV